MFLLQGALDLSTYDDLTGGERIQFLFQNFINGFKNFFTGLKNGLIALQNVANGIDTIDNNISDLKNFNSLDMVNFDTFIAAIRWCVGDVVFTEMYIVLMIGLGYVLFVLLCKFMQLANYLINLVSKNNAGLGASNNPVLNFLFRVFRIGG